MDLDDEDDGFWDDVSPPVDFLRRGQSALEEPDIAENPAEALGLRRSRHVGRQGMTGRASGLDPQPVEDVPHVPDWGDEVEVEPVIDDGSFGRRKRPARQAVPARDSHGTGDRRGSPASDMVDWDDLPMPSEHASRAAQRLGDSDAYAQLLVPLGGEDLSVLRDQIAARTPLFEQMEQARRATDRSFQLAPPLGALLVIGWAFVFGRGLVNRLIDATADGRVTRLIERHDWYADPQQGARIVAIATGAIDLVLIVTLLIAGVAAFIHTLARRSVEQLPLAIIDLGMATLMSMLLLARPSFTIAALLLIVTLLVQRPLRALGRIAFARRSGVRGGARSSSQNAVGPQKPRTQAAAPTDDEPAGLMLRLLQRLRGGRDA